MIKKILTVITLVWLGACDSESGESAATGTETNWLKSCEQSSECGVGSCVCGLCTFECEEASDCSDAPAAARCASGRDPEYIDACGAETVTGLCLRAEGVGSDDDASADDSSADDTDDDVGSGDDTSGSDDPAAEPDPQSGSDDDSAPNADSGSDDDVVGTGGSGNAGSNAGGTSSGTGGNPSTGGVSAGGAAGTSSTPLCDPGCVHICEGGLCDCFCEPVQDWARCDAPSDCVLAPSDCCACGDFDAVNGERLAEHEAAVCPYPGEAECAACMPGRDPYLMPACIEGVCTAVRLNETPLTECELDMDCTVTEPSCCPTCTEITNPSTQLISISAEQGLEFQQTFCEAELACPPCLTLIPETVGPRCYQGRCIVDVASGANDSVCPAPAGTQVPVTVHPTENNGGFQCQSGVLSSTLITSQEELDDFATACGRPALANSPLVVPEVDFESRVLFAVVGYETLSVSFDYAVTTADGIHVGATREAYCGGAAPPDSVLFVEMDPPSVPVVHDSCSHGECTGPLPP